jgi:hypothetical protein
VLTRGDRILLALTAALLLALWPLAAASGGQAGDRMVVVEGPSGRTTVPLSEDTELVIEGLLGPVRVQVMDQTVRVRDAGCPDHICELTGPVSSPSSVIACVPNGVSVRVEGRGDAGLDAVVR